MATFGAEIRARRKAMGMTAEGLARRVGCSRSLIVKIEAGEREKVIAKYVRIAKALGCRIDDLFPEMDEPEEEKKVSEGKTVCADGFEDESMEGWEE